jgi:hypothetical protein
VGKDSYLPEGDCSDGNRLARKFGSFNCGSSAGRKSLVLGLKPNQSMGVELNYLVRPLQVGELLIQHAFPLFVGVLGGDDIVNDL